MIFNLFLYILICYGLTDIIVTGEIFKKIRPQWRLFHCYQCMGTWIGAIIFLIFWFSGIKLFPNIYFGIFLFGFLSSGVSNFFCSIYDDEGLKISFTKHNKS